LGIFASLGQYIPEGMGNTGKKNQNNIFNSHI